MDLTLTTGLLIGLGALIGGGVLSLGLLVGYRRGIGRGKLLAAQQNDRSDV